VPAPARGAARAPATAHSLPSMSSWPRSAANERRPPIASCAMEARLLIACPDRHGIVAAVSGFLAARDANIVSSAQHSTDPEGGEFFMRMAFTIDAIGEEFARAFATEVAERFAMEWRLDDAERAKRVAVLVSREDHCLLDLLWRRRRGELHCEIPLVISNHPDHAGDVEGFGARYEHVPVAKGEKPAAEARMLDLLAGQGFDLVVLARYMQILSGDFLAKVGCPVINIHHSFLPAFAGADPYRRAQERGVKVIGATAHYVTEDLDAGPIIEQDVVRVTHREGVDALVRIGRDVERTVLARAVGLHLEDRVLVHENRTVVF
jgi:formyltetrahydrofolate deformylase